MKNNVSLFFQQGTSDKEYHLQVERAGGGYVVNFQFGRRGKRLQTGSKTPLPVSQAEAVEIRDAVLREKLAKGYHEQGTSQPSPAAPAKKGPRPQRAVVATHAKVEPAFARSLERAVR